MHQQLSGLHYTNFKVYFCIMKTSGARATPKHWPIEKIFGRDFFLHNWNRLEGCHDIVSDFYFFGPHYWAYYHLVEYTITNCVIKGPSKKEGHALGGSLRKCDGL